MSCPQETLEEEFERLGLHPWDPAGGGGISEEPELDRDDPEVIHAEDLIADMMDDELFKSSYHTDEPPARVEPGLGIEDFTTGEYDGEVIDAEAEIQYGYYLEQLREQEERDRQG